MAAPITHILVPMILLEVYRRNIAKKRFSYWYVLLGGLAGLIPDFDFFAMHANKLLNGSYQYAHRMWSHSLLIVLAVILFAAICHWISKKKARTAEHRSRLRTTYKIFYIIAFGMLTHTILDMFNGMIQFAYPLSWSIYLPNLMYPSKVAMMVDGIFLIVWLLLDERVFNPMLKWVNSKTARAHLKKR